MPQNYFSFQLIDCNFMQTYYSVMQYMVPQKYIDSLHFSISSLTFQIKPVTSWKYEAAYCLPFPHEGTYKPYTFWEPGFHRH